MKLKKQQMNNPKIIFVMGVSGSGKSTIGKLLAEKLEIPFFDGDDFHPEANVKKMAEGHPLNDTDRQGWLERLNQLAIDHKKRGAVIVCSALKHKYRKTLTNELNDRYRFVFLKGSMELIDERLSKRKGHYMPKTLLKSQFEALETPENALEVDIKNTPEEIVDFIVKDVEN